MFAWKTWGPDSQAETTIGAIRQVRQQLGASEDNERNNADDL